MSEITELIIPEHYDYKNYNIDQCVTTNVNFLRNVSRVRDDEQADDPVEFYKNDTMPYIFHPYTEDIPIEKRAALLKEENEASAPDDAVVYSANPHERVDAYHDDDAEENYLRSTPTSYVIFSKPNVGEVQLARALAEQSKCVFISPESVIRDEIGSGSRVGKCIEFNLQNGRAVGPEVVLRLVERRVKSQTVEHRGFVIAGFPLIPNHLYRDEPLSSESAVFNVEEIFEDVLIETIPDRPATASTLKGSKVTLEAFPTGQGEEEEEQQEEEEEKRAVDDPIEVKKETVDVDLGPDMGSIIKASESFADLLAVENQLSFLLSLFNHNTIVIYVACGNSDVITKTGFCRFDLNYEEQVSFEKIPDGHGETDFLERENGNELKEALRLPTHLHDSVSAQLLAYRTKLRDRIEKRILLHDPQLVVRVDGRLSVDDMFEALRQRLKILGLQPVLLPDDLNRYSEMQEGLDEEAPEPDGYGATPEKSFKRLRSLGIVGPMYKRRLSHWGFRCPVAYKDGKRVKGEAQHAVAFMDKVYFLSDADAVVRFCRNPRPYLLPVKIKPRNRIFVVGPDRCGKTMLSKCLSLLFNSHVLDVAAMEHKYKTKKRFEYLERVRTAAITEGFLELKSINERNRRLNVDYWMRNVRAMLLSYYSELDLELEHDVPNIRSTASVQSHISEKTLLDIESELRELNLVPHDADEVKLLLEDDERLAEYLPPDLTGPVEPPSVHDSFITNYVNRVLASTVYEDEPLTAAETIDMFEAEVAKFELRYGENQSWVVDGFPPQADVVRGVDVNELVDVVVCLRDDDPENVFLLARFARNSRADDVELKNLFRQLRRFTAAGRVPSDIGPSDAYAFLLDTIKAADKQDDPLDDVEVVQSNRNQEYADHLAEFNARWLETRRLLEQTCAEPPIEIDVANKSPPQLLKECIVRIENLYRMTASHVTDDDRIEQLRDFGGGGSSGAAEDVRLGEAGEDPFEDNRRYGDTSGYCPVAFHDHFVLWKGAERFAASFEDKTYLLSGQEALDAFVDNPYVYSRDGPSDAFPPPRICITGAIGSGKTTLARELAENLGLFYVNFEDILLKAFNLDTITRVDDLLQQHDKDDEEIYSTEKEILRNYHIDEENLLPELYFRKSLDPLWHSSPYRNVGFVLDHFPRKANDLKYMKKLYYIPDVVIELEVNQKQLHDRLFSLKLNKWRRELQLKKKQTEEENAVLLDKWQDEYRSRVAFLREMLRDERRQEFLYSQPPVPPFSSPVDSTADLPEEERLEKEELPAFVYDPVQEKVDLEEIEKRVAAELPTPLFQDQWESEEEATERIEEMLNEIHVRDLKYLKSLKFELKKDNIDSVSLLTDGTARQIFLETCKILEKYKFRNGSFFERVYAVAPDVAERLLQQGTYFASKFGRTCPVQVHERRNPIQMYLSAERKRDVRPLIHRRYVYFACDANRADKFKRDPLLYVGNADHRLPLLPLRVAVIGPPKCGKSYLADRFRSEYGLKVVTRGEAARYVLGRLRNYELAKSMANVLRKGWSLTYEMVAAAVEAFTSDGKSATEGYVLDGFPASVEEMQHLQRFGIVPHVCFHVSADERKVEECTRSEPDRRFMAAMSHKFIQIRCEAWRKGVDDLTGYMRSEFQNIYWIDGPDSKWDIWNRANVTSSRVFFDVLDYFKKRNVNAAHSLRSLLVTPFEFLQRQSAFEHFCPCCVLYRNHLVSGGCPPDRNGLVQYRDRYYWVCDEHLAAFTADPRRHTPPHIAASLPENVPEMGSVCCVAPKCCSQRYYESGLCVVCFWDSQPKRVLNTGRPDHAALYNDVIYVFCSAACQQRFLKEPHAYFDKVINFRDPVPLELKRKLPTIGYLEQHVADLLTRAVANTELARPVHPFMDVKTCAAIYLGLYLKLHNPKTSPDRALVNKQQMDRFDNRRKQIKSFIEFFMANQNPFCENISVDCAAPGSASISDRERPSTLSTERTSSYSTATDKLRSAEKSVDMRFGEAESVRSENTLDDVSFYGFGE